MKSSILCVFPPNMDERMNNQKQGAPLALSPSPGYSADMAARAGAALAGCVMKLSIKDGNGTTRSDSHS